MKIRYFVAETIVKWFKRLGFCGALRFRIIRLGYKVFGGCRTGEWDFTFRYLPPLASIHRNKLKVLDIGCTASLFIYEIKKRGYLTYGLDQRDYQERLPNDIMFYKEDIITCDLNWKFHYIVALSMMEHVGLEIKNYNTKKIENGDRKAIENIHKLLKDDGYFIITVPVEHWENIELRGYTPRMFLNLIKGLFDIYEITQKDGQICAVLIKSL